MSYTPLTDAAAGTDNCVHVDFARGLERSNADMLALLHNIREEIDGLIGIDLPEFPRPKWARNLATRIDEVLSKAEAK